LIFLKILDNNSTAKNWKQIPFIPIPKLFSSYFDNKIRDKCDRNLENDDLLDKEIQIIGKKKYNVSENLNKIIINYS
jgi:hypothetical protein